MVNVGKYTIHACYAQMRRMYGLFTNIRLNMAT